MQLDIRFPILARINPKSSKKGERYFYGVRVHRADIPEIAMRESDVVLGPCRARTGSHGSTSLPELRVYADRVYRPVGPETSKVFDEAFGRASMLDVLKAARNYVSGPVSDPISERCAWFIDMHGMETARNYKLSPDLARYLAAKRNGHVIDNADIESVNSGDLAEFERMYRAHADRLIMMDGAYWIETTMPCVNVIVAHDDDYSSRAAATTSVSLGFLPLGFDARGGVYRFPLDMAAEAMEFARAWPLDQPLDTVDLNLSDCPDFLSFDQCEEEIHGFALSVGSNLVRRHEQHRFHKIYATAPPLFEGDRLERFETIRSSVLANNDITDERASLAPLLPDMLELWDVVKRARYAGLGAPSTQSLKYVKARALEMLDNATIDVRQIVSVPGF